MITFDLSGPVDWPAQWPIWGACHQVHTGERVTQHVTTVTRVTVTGPSEIRTVRHGFRLHQKETGKSWLSSTHVHPCELAHCGGASGVISCRLWRVLDTFCALFRHLKAVPCWRRVLQHGDWTMTADSGGSRVGKNFATMGFHSCVMEIKQLDIWICKNASR